MHQIGRTFCEYIIACNLFRHHHRLSILTNASLSTLEREFSCNRTCYRATRENGAICYVRMVPFVNVELIDLLALIVSFNNTQEHKHHLWLICSLYVLS